MERIKYYSNPILISATYLNSQQKDYPVQAITYKSVAAECGLQDMKAWNHMFTSNDFKSGSI